MGLDKSMDLMSPIPVRHSRLWIKLKVYLNGDGSGKPGRFATFASAIERNVIGPFFFGEKMTYLDFVFANQYGLSEAGMLQKFEAKTGVDLFAPYPKLQAIAKSIRGLDSIKDSGMIELPEKFGMKDDILE